MIQTDFKAMTPYIFKRCTFEVINSFFSDPEVPAKSLSKFVRQEMQGMV